MADVEGFVRQHPGLVPALRAMVEEARADKAQPYGGRGEFNRRRVAAREPRTPPNLSLFLRWGLIQESPWGRGGGRKFYVLTDQAAIQRVLGMDSD